MLDQLVEEWMLTLREEDRPNIRQFLTSSVEFLSKHVDFLRGSGFYVVGSSFSHNTYVLKGDWQERERKAKEELTRRLIESFGKDKLEEFCKTHRRFRELLPEGKEIQRMIAEGYDTIVKKARIGRDHYDDIDCVIAGLTRAKANPELVIWAEFSKYLKAKFLNAKHPDEPDFLFPNGFGMWEVYDDYEKYIASSYELQLLTNKEPTKIHFMLYVSDERFGSKVIQTGKQIWNFHTEPSEDVSLEMWKEQQKKDKLPFLTIIEF